MKIFYEYLTLICLIQHGIFILIIHILRVIDTSDYFKVIFTISITFHLHVNFILAILFL